MCSEYRDTLAAMVDGAEHFITAFVKGDVSALLLRLLELDTTGPKSITSALDGRGERDRIRIEWELRSTDIYLNCYPPGAWVQYTRAQPLPDLRQCWLLVVSTDLRLSRLVEAGDDLEEIALALLLRVFAESSAFCVMETDRAPGRVDLAVVVDAPGHAEVLIAADEDGPTFYSEAWARAINSGIKVRGVKNLRDFDIYADVSPLRYMGKSPDDTAPEEIAALLSKLASSGTIEWKAGRPE